MSEGGTIAVIFMLGLAWVLGSFLMSEVFIHRKRGGRRSQSPPMARPLPDRRMPMPPPFAIDEEGDDE